MKRIALFLFAVLLTTLVNAQIIVNGYAKVTNIAGAVLTVNNVNETNDTFEDGEYIVIMQMQDNVIGANTADNINFGNLSAIASAGLYEVAQIQSHTEVASLPNTITLTGALGNTYNFGANSSLQIITFRNLGAPNFSTVSDITGLAWNGNIGGVISFSVGGVLTLNNNITADAIGFRGGTRSNNFYDGTTNCINTPFRANNTNHGFKGEGIYKSTLNTYNNCRAKILNGGGGGNHINGGGAGGGNYSAGGDGGRGWNGTAGGCSVANSVGGIGGIALSTQINVNRIFMGGGGGGGQQNDNVGSSGGNGGGIILIKANQLITSGACASRRISANGQTAGNSGNDGSGGAGAGGSIVLQIPSYAVLAGCPLVVSTNGGNGGNVISSTHSGGGGGGQGAIFISIPTPIPNLTPQSNAGNGGCNQNPCSTNAGSGGGPNGAGIASDVIGVLPVELMYFNADDMNKKVALTWATMTERNSNYFHVQRSNDAQNWTTLGKVKAAENSNKTLYYEFNDESPVSGVSYYRLKIEDLDMSLDYSDIKVVERNEKETFVILYPNPATDRINLASSYNINEIIYEVFDVSGKQVMIVGEVVSDDKLVLDLSGLAKGLYFMSIKTPDGKAISTQKIILK